MSGLDVAGRGVDGGEVAGMVDSSGRVQRGNRKSR